MKTGKKTVTTTSIISNCWFKCPYYFAGFGEPMECTHPYFKRKPVYSGCIITHENSHEGFPDDCPLFIEEK